MEAWKEVKGSQGRYEVSTFGNIRSFLKMEKGRFHQTETPQRILALANDKNGYLQCSLWLGGKRKIVKVHRIVLETFVGPCPEGMECCHTDNNKQNNSLANLRWDTHRNNQVKDGGCLKFLVKGAGHPGAKYSQATIDEIRKERAETGTTHQRLADRYGMTRRYIGRILDRSRWI